MVTAATAAAKTTVLALVAGLMAALRMKYMSVDRHSGSLEGVANTTKADELGTIKVRVVVDFLTASNTANMRFRNKLLLFLSHTHTHTHILFSLFLSLSPEFFGVHQKRTRESQDQD